MPILPIASILAIVLLSCTSTGTTLLPWETFPSRAAIDDNIYRARVPSHWIRTDPITQQQLADTTQPNAAFTIDNDIYLTIHTFPNKEAKQKIPPMAQVARWQRQLQQIDETTLLILPYSHGGFHGYSFEAEGSLNNTKTKVLAWAMQIDQQHEQTLRLRTKKNGATHYTQYTADYTIKAVGPANKIDEYARNITRFARTFELIQPIVASQ
ncbi:hypothetical protein JYU14_02245 [Simkania negevensis]|uniref:Lipoprotein n=1 Tax=Simkania negevensis TaxID=83561 RepID=A0ABS3ARA1_9BACT|nr:hypothetical protein [Simkania negevensis]